MVFLFAAVVTAIVPDWIKAVTGLDPDGGDGAVEWAIVAVLGALALVAAWLARRDYLLTAS